MATTKKPRSTCTRKKPDAEDIPVEKVAEVKPAARPATKPAATAKAKVPAAARPAADKPVEAKATEPASAAPKPKEKAEEIVAAVDGDPTPKSGVEADAPSQAAGAMPPPASSIRPGWYVAGILVLLFGGGVIFAAAQPHVLKLLPGVSTQAEISESLTALTGRVDGVERTVGALPTEAGVSAEDVQSRIAEATGPIAEQIGDLDAWITEIANRPVITTDGTPVVDLSPLTGQLDAQATNIAALEARIAKLQTENTVLKAALDSDLGGLEERLAAVEASRAPELAGRALALGALATAVRSENPYVGELAALQALGAELPEGGPLVANAQSGIPTLGQLRGSVSEAIRAAQFAASVPEGATNTDRALGVLKSMFAPRPANPVEGDSVDAVISRAEAALDTDDLGGAIATFETLRGPAAEAMAPWLTTAHARADTLAALAALENSVRQTLSARIGN